MTALAPHSSSCCPIIELRHYVLHPGRRDELVSLFDLEFVESQEALGMTIVAQFRDLDRPDDFVWIRGFPDMASRGARLGEFYSGPAWQRHRDAANATMVSFDDVRLLHPVSAEAGFSLGPRSAVGEPPADTGLYVATIYTLRPEAADGFADFFADRVQPALHACGILPLAVLETERSENDFPRLPVREGERAFVWFARYATEDEHRRASRALTERCAWESVIEPAIAANLASPTEVWRLAPTARSRRLGTASP